jgi:hypothetical protein
MALQGVSEGGKFPGSQMSGQKQNAFAPGIGALEVFEAVIDDHACDIFFRVSREEADLSELTSEGNEFSANYPALLAWVHLGKGEREVA